MDPLQSYFNSQLQGADNMELDFQEHYGDRFMVVVTLPPQITTYADASKFMCCTARLLEKRYGDCAISSVINSDYRTIEYIVDTQVFNQFVTSVKGSED